MGNYYRINARFNLDDEEERQAVEFLTDLRTKDRRSASSFITEAVCEKIQRPYLEQKAFLNDIEDVVRKAVRSELENITISGPDNKSSSPQFPVCNIEISTDEKEASILDALDAFGC